MSINSKAKGTRYERHVAGLLRNYGYDARRGQQYCGANGDADVVGLPGIHIECKNVQKLNISNAMKQSMNDAKKGEIPAVFHKRDREPTMVTLLFDDFMTIYTEWEAVRNG